MGRYPAVYLMGHDPIPSRQTFPGPHAGAEGISLRFPEVVPEEGQVGHVLLTRSPLYPARRRLTRSTCMC